MSLKYLSDKICVPSKTEYTYSNVFNIITEEMNKNPQFCMFHVNARVNSIYRKKVEKLCCESYHVCLWIYGKVSGWWILEDLHISKKHGILDEWKSCFFFKNWDSLHARLNSHYKAWVTRKTSTKKVTAYRKSV